ncbi:reverse transcriptase domain-containing protein [Tanacetum coccineum]
MNVPLVDVLAGMPNYEKFLKDLLPPKLVDPGSFLIPCTIARSVEYLTMTSLGTSIKLIPYSLYASLSRNTLKPTRMSILLANYTYQYPMGIAKNMLVQVGKFVFLADFVILQMEEDEKVLLILGRPFLHTIDAIIRVKNKELNLGVGDDRITFLIDKDMRHSHSNDDTCFCVDIKDEVMEEELDALLNNSKPFSTTSKKIRESFLDHEFKELMAVEIEEIPEQEEEFENNFEVLPLEGNQIIKNSTQDPPTDLVMKPLPEHLEYAFLEKDSLLSVVISALLQDDEKKRLVSVLKKHKEAFAWKTSNIPGISPSFCKHKINFKDDAKPVIQRQCRLNTNMKEIVKKEIIKLLDAGIIYAIEDSPWVSPVHCVPKKGGMTVVTNEKNELIPTRIVTGWRVCIDYRKLNKATRKYHFTLPFMDQMLERHEGFYRQFIQDFSKISRPMTKLLKKDAVFDFNEECIEAFELLKEKLTNAPIMVSPDWLRPFKLMCDASDFAVEAVLGQWEGKRLCPIHFASKTLNNAQQNYTVTEKELLAIDHSALKYLFAKQDAKPRLIRWILLLQEFDIEIKNKKGAENVAADHLSRLENPHLEELRDDNINDNFPDETLMNGIHFMGPFLKSHKFEYILVAIDYVSKWAEAEALPTNDARVMINFLKKLFSRFGIPKALISDRDELILQAYENSKLYKARTKAYHDRKIRIRKEFKAGDKVLLYNSKYKFKAPKLRSKWYGSFMVKHGFLSGYVELYDKHGGSFIINGHRVKLYHDEEQINELATE